VVEGSAYDIGEAAADIDSNLEHAGWRITIVRQFPLARQAADGLSGWATVSPFSSRLRLACRTLRLGNSSRAPDDRKGGRPTKDKT
jgi:hypothetical protein